MKYLVRYLFGEVQEMEVEAEDEDEAKRNASEELYGEATLGGRLDLDGMSYAVLSAELEEDDGE